MGYWHQGLQREVEVLYKVNGQMQVVGLRCMLPDPVDYDVGTDGFDSYKRWAEEALNEDLYIEV